MKKITLTLSAILTLLLVSCTTGGRDGLDGLNGFDGRDGIDGVNGQDAPLSQVIEIEGDFTADNDYNLFFEFDSTVEVFETDLVLVYILFDQTTDNNGEPVDIWRLLPQTLLVDQGLLQYNFDHTFLDVNIFLEADFDLSLLLPGDTDSQVFRIAVIPGEASSKSSLDKSNISSVMALLGVEEKDILKIKL